MPNDPKHRVYIVMGMEGDYEDRTEWPVRAYLDKAAAERHAADARALAQLLTDTKVQFPGEKERPRWGEAPIEAHTQAFEAWKAWRTRWYREQMGDLDPETTRDTFHGVDYFVSEAPLAEGALRSLFPVAVDPSIEERR